MLQRGYLVATKRLLRYHQKAIKTPPRHHQFPPKTQEKPSDFSSKAQNSAIARTDLEHILKRQIYPEVAINIPSVSVGNGGAIIAIAIDAGFLFYKALRQPHLHRRAIA